MGIFKNITKILKKAAPLIGSTIGFAFGGPAGAAIGSGIGSLAGGRSVEDALMNAGLAYGVGSFAKGAGFGKGTGEGIERFLPSKDGVSAFGLGSSPSNAMFANDAAASITPTAIKTVDSGGIGSFFKDNMGKIALGGAALGALSGEEEQKTAFKDPYADMPEGRTRLGVVPYKGVVYNLDNKAERDAYNKKRQDESVMFAAGGGEVDGPGTGTSDSVPARLSDGEFVVTAKAVRGAGGGDRNVGAARMYDMMSQLERVA
jgi:hypothetical protein